MLNTKSKKVDISIIIPLFKGDMYIDRLIKMIKANYLYMEMYEKCDLEVVFVNDFPEQTITVSETIFPIRMYNNCENQGIHRTRVNGVGFATGNYIIMLDQDDLIIDSYLYSQWEKIKKENADFCVCNGWSGRFRTLGNEQSYEKLINNLEHYFVTGNPIMSPGQVIMKKESIPTEWLENIQSRNGADDSLLWMLVLLKGGKFVFNREYLFYHTPERTKDSVGASEMAASVVEMKQILKRLEYLSEKTERQLEQQLKERQYINGLPFDAAGNIFFASVSNLKYITKFRKMFFVMLDWNRLRSQGKSIESYMVKNGYHSVAIQGMGYIGELLYEELKNSSIDVRYAIDRSAIDFKGELDVFRMEEELPKVDLIISTVLEDSGALVAQLKEKCNCKVLRIDEILNELK